MENSLLSSKTKKHRLLASVFSDHMVLQRDANIPIWGMGKPKETLIVSIGSFMKKCTAGEDGNWSVVFDPIASQEALVIRVESTDSVVEIHDVLMGDVWLCSGQSNMAFTLRNEEGSADFIATSKRYKLRHLSIPTSVAHKPMVEFDGEWHVSDPATAGDFSAVAYHFGVYLQENLDIPIGLITSAYGGSTAEAWIRAECLETDPELTRILRGWEKFVKEYSDDPVERQAIAKKNAEKLIAQGIVPPPWELEPKGPNHFHRPGLLFNAMIHPLLPFPIRGVLWYQGEANNARAAQYPKLLTTLIQDWRRLWNAPDLWFFLMQLPQFDAPWLLADGFTEVREAQAQVASQDAHAEIVCTVDLGDAEEIHPVRKKEISVRAAKAALANTYHQNIIFSGPRFRSIQIEKNDIRIFFNHAEGLHFVGKELTGFSIAGEDRCFTPARAVLENDSVLIEHEGNAVAVRYAWANAPQGNLQNQAGLPAFPFRTDDWPKVTAGNYEPEM